MPSGVGTLTVDGRSAPLPFLLAPGGEPLLALVPIAERFGVRTRIGPLGDSLTLMFEDRNLLLGTESLVMVSEDVDGGRPQITTLRRRPVSLAGQFYVPLDLIESALGEKKGYELAWDSVRLDLTANRRQLRELTASLKVVHLHRLSTVEIRFSQTPRYRIEHLDGALEIRLVGDLLQLPVAGAADSGPLIEKIEVAADRLRIDLADNAAAGEPRLLSSPVVRLVVEVFQRTSAPPDDADELEIVSTRESKVAGVHTIVLDPGHGGAETGAIGSRGTTEKDLTLQVARRLEQTLKRRLPVKVILTRTDDVAVSHDSRTALANHHQADLFISLHFNSTYGPGAHGAETYFLSREASDQLAAALAEEENTSGAPQEVGGHSDSDLELILWDLAQTYHLNESQRFANLVQEELNQALGLRNRGVKQAPFRVLMGANMPAVLVELGFLSNPQEERQLESPSYQAELVDALVSAVIRFRAQQAAGMGAGSP